MKAARSLGLVAVAIFAISYFLPAYGDAPGFACFEFCWKMILGHDTDLFSGSCFYYSGLVISNVLFVGLVVALFATKKGRRLRSFVSVVCFLHVLSWMVVHIVSGTPSQIMELKIGYYVWLTAYCLLIAAQCREPADSLRSIPLARSVA